MSHTAYLIALGFQIGFVCLYVFAVAVFLCEVPKDDE